MPKITFIGAGSLVFTRNLCSDILLVPSLPGSTIALMDIDPARLEQSRQIVQSIADRRKLRAKVETLNRTNINVQELTVEAALTGSKEAIYHAAMLDPLTAAVCTLPQIRSMVDEMLEAQKAWLPQF